MKVFVNRSKSIYATVMVIVAAHSPEEAHKVAASSVTCHHLYDWYDYNNDCPTDDLEVISSNYIPKENWSEMEGVKAKVDEPTILAEIDNVEGGKEPFR